MFEQLSCLLYCCPLCISNTNHQTLWTRTHLPLAGFVSCCRNLFLALTLRENIVGIHSMLIAINQWGQVEQIDQIRDLDWEAPKWRKQFMLPHQVWFILPHIWDGICMKESTFLCVSALPLKLDRSEDKTRAPKSLLILFIPDDRILGLVSTWVCFSSYWQKRTRTLFSNLVIFLQPNPRMVIRHALVDTQYFLLLFFPTTLHTTANSPGCWADEWGTTQASSWERCRAALQGGTGHPFFPRSSWQQHKLTLRSRHLTVRDNLSTTVWAGWLFLQKET